MLKQALRMTARDWRAGELRFLLLALIVAVAALSAGGFFIDRMRAALERDAHQMLGADLILMSDEPVPLAWRERAQQQGLLVADTVTFPSMAQAGEGEDSLARLASVKAVSPGYPLRGQVRITRESTGAPNSRGSAATGGPAPGTVWLDPELLIALHAQLGDMLQLGESQLRITDLITAESDRGAGFANFAPRVMLALADLPATGLVNPLSRVSYRLQVAAPTAQQRAALVDFETWLRAQIKADASRGLRIETLESGRPEMRATLERAELFLALVGLLSAMLAALAVAMAARRFMARHLDACAMLRCLGLTQHQVSLMYLIEFALVGLVGSAIGVLVGFAAHLVLVDLIASLLGAELPPATLRPVLMGMATGMVLLTGFALPPILQLRNVPHTRVIRREQGAPRPAALLSYGLGLGTFLLLLLWQAGDVRLALSTALGFIGGCGVFALLAWLMLLLLRRWRTLLPHQAWRFAVTSLQRRPAATVVQVVALALGLMALLLLTVVRADLMSAWQMATPADAPNRFVINIQPDQKEGVEQQLRAAGVASPVLYPMIRGRLVAINGQELTGAQFSDGEARRMAQREFNLSTTNVLPAANEVVAGDWFADRAGQPEASVEQSLMQRLGLKLGDTIRFDMASVLVEARITSVRKLEWGSMRANFFVIINPAAMQDAPTTYMTAFHQPEQAAGLGNALTRQFPNLTVIDVSGIIAQLQEVMDQVVTAVEFLFLFTLAAGILVLYAALMGSQAERTREAGLLRALGATRQQLAQAQRIEFLLVGSVAGLLAASGAALLGWALATYVFKFAWSFSPLVWIAGLAAGVLCALFGGWLGLRGVLRQPPLQTLREA